MSNKFFVLSFITLMLSSCGVPIAEQPGPTTTPPLRTATPPATPTWSSTRTPLATLPPTTVVPVAGMTSSPINVRAQPSSAATILGVIPANTPVEITGRDPGGSWWQINYPQGQDGKGWVTAQYITTAAKLEVPTIGRSASTPGTENLAVIQQQLNVRSGPGTRFNSLGTLNAQDVVSLTGKDENGGWLQVDFSEGPGGKGWVNAAFVQAQGVESLPIVTDTGLIIGTGTPTAVPPTPTATVVPAYSDHDSATHPLARVLLDPLGTSSFLYQGDVSTPQGDREDWVAFEPYDPFVYLSLECSGSAVIRAEIVEGRSLSSDGANIECGTPAVRVAVEPGSEYLVHVQTVASSDPLQYANYILTIKAGP